MAAPCRGAAGFNFARDLRGRLDDMLRNLNIPKVQKEAMTGLLANLPVFNSHAAKGDWPKWLTRKSYFKEGLFFYQLAREIDGGPRAQAEQLLDVQKEKFRGKRKRRPKKRKTRNPAVRKSGGGIFGLR